MTVTAEDTQVERCSSLVALAVSLRQTSKSAPNISTEVGCAGLHPAACCTPLTDLRAVWCVCRTLWPAVTRYCPSSTTWAQCSL